MPEEPRYPDKIISGEEAAAEDNLRRLSINERERNDLEDYKAEVAAQLKLMRETKKQMDRGRSFYGQAIQYMLDNIIALLEEEDYYLSNPREGLEPVLNRKALKDLPVLLSGLDKKHYDLPDNQ